MIAAGIACDTVPGISAAQGAAAALGIPLTHRDHAGTLLIATGHLQGTGDNATVALDWPALARPRQTVVIYMGIGTLGVICHELMAHGLPADTPAALIERATWPQERSVFGTLQTLPALQIEHHIKPPALIMIGDTVTLHARIGPNALVAIAAAAQ